MPPTRARSREKPSTLEAYRRVLRFVRAHSLAEGDRLPTQAELVKRLRVCHGTLATAMKWLVEDDVLSRRQKLGTFLRHPYPAAPRRAIWRAATVMPPIGPSYFGAVLSQYLHQRMGRAGISDRMYMLDPYAAPSVETPGREPRDFSGLQEDIDLGLLDAIATGARLRRASVPVCGVASWDSCEFGVLVDMEHFVAASVRLLRERGRRRLLYVSPYQPEEWCRKQAKALARASRAMQEAGGRLESLVRYPQSPDGAALIDSLLARRASDRPDAIVVQDDITAQSLAARLVHTPYRPLLVSQTNKQIPLSYAIPTVPFALDLDGLAARATEVLLDKLLDPAKPGRLEYFQTRLHEMPEATASNVGA